MASRKMEKSMEDPTRGTRVGIEKERRVLAGKTMLIEQDPDQMIEKKTRADKKWNLRTGSTKTANLRKESLKKNLRRNLNCKIL